MLMLLGIPYDSDQGRNYAAAITALMTGQAYLQSSRLAAELGPFDGFAKDRDGMMAVIDAYEANALKLQRAVPGNRLAQAALRVWHETAQAAHLTGLRNSQVVVIAPVDS
jgi:ribonucleoside-diphosphate reductase alpha chain